MSPRPFVPVVEMSLAKSDFQKNDINSERLRLVI